MRTTSDVPARVLVRSASSRRWPRPGGEPAPEGEVLTTRVGLQITSDLTFEVWERAGRQLARIVDSSAWWLGDWLVYGKDNYADRYQLGIQAAGLKYQTLRNYAWVSRRFELSRRRGRLSFQHHAEVASLPFEEQEYWLDHAEEKGWSTRQLRDSIQDARSVGSPSSEGCGAAVQRIAFPGSRVQWWHQAAEKSGVEFEKWVLVTLDGAAKQVLDSEEHPKGSDAVEELGGSSVGVV